jgi:hypothetical protein
VEQVSSIQQTPAEPALAWVELKDWSERSAWYRAVVAAYGELWERHAAQACPTPGAARDLALLEARLGCALPEGLRRYHLELGALSLAETLCSVSASATPIEPLRDAYPGIVEIVFEPDDLALVDALVAFGDYLGNGNMFCFHRITGAVYYFDHDSGAPLVRFADAVEDYLDALMIRCLGEIHDQEEAAEALLVGRFGDALVRKWLY